MPEFETYEFERFKVTLDQRYPLGLIPRKEIGVATGKILNPRTMANEDCLKKGIEDPVLIGRQVCYRVDKVIEYFEKKISKRNTRKAV